MFFRTLKDDVHRMKNKESNNQTQQQNNYKLKTTLKRWFLGWVLNVERSLHSRMCFGSEFHREGAAMEKANTKGVALLPVIAE